MGKLFLNRMGSIDIFGRFSIIRVSYVCGPNLIFGKYWAQLQASHFPRKAIIPLRLQLMCRYEWVRPFNIICEHYLRRDAIYGWYAVFSRVEMISDTCRHLRAVSAVMWNLRAISMYFRHLRAVSGICEIYERYLCIFAIYGMYRTFGKVTGGICRFVKFTGGIQFCVIATTFVRGCSRKDILFADDARAQCHDKKWI